MSSLKKLFIVLGRLPLLFIVDSTLKGSFINFSVWDFVDKLFGDDDFRPQLSPDSIITEHTSDLAAILWSALLVIVTISSIILVCSPIESLLEVYGCFFGCRLLFFSYQCNSRFIEGVDYMQPLLFSDNQTEDNNITNVGDMHRMSAPSILINVLTQLFIVLAFDQICIVGTLGSLCTRNVMVKCTRYPTDIFLFLSCTLPVFLYAFLDRSNFLYQLSPALALLLPVALLAVHTFFVVLTIFSLVIPAVRDIKVHIREMGLDGLLVRLMEKANLSWLLRIFFFTKVSYCVLTSKTLRDADAFDSLSWSETFNVGSLLALEVLHTMCDTILSVMSMASIVSIISGLCLKIIYNIIGAYDEEESLQPAVSGFLFVLLAMQTGITSITSDSRLQLLFQNCILLLVANQHFVQTVAGDLLLKASTDDVTVKKHVRPMLPYLLFFSFPFLVVMRLWHYPFRISWLLAISAFSLELIIKSVMTLSVYILNMLHTHMQYFQETMDDLLFYIKAGCGCLEFVCGIFLFLNGAYIFIFESGGIIRLVMMIIHLYCNIYQTAVKGLATYRLRQSAWEKVNKLQSASQEQLDENDDICPICYQEMKEAVVIKCSHVFHKNCLQKWLSIQETCPLCHTDLKDDAPPSANSNIAADIGR
ncbi:Protein trc8 [Bulinus truncatus]|nr:Protein trc8 [Bulinus truncatus]